MHLSFRKLDMQPRQNGYTKEFFFRTASSYVFSLQLLFLINGWGDLVESSLKFFSLKNPSPDEERERERERSREFLDEDESDIGCESDVGLDGKDQLNRDLDSEHSDGDL